MSAWAMAKKRSSKRRSPWLRGYYDEFEFWTEHDVVRTVQSVRRWSGPRSGLLAIGVGHPVPQDDSLIPRSSAICAADAVLSRASSTARRQNFGRIRCRHLDSLQAISAITEQVSREGPRRPAGSRPSGTATDNLKALRSPPDGGLPAPRPAGLPDG
jgi:hypothetical protein